MKTASDEKVTGLLKFWRNPLESKPAPAAARNRNSRCWRVQSRTPTSPSYFSFSASSISSALVNTLEGLNSLNFRSTFVGQTPKCLRGRLWILKWLFRNVEFTDILALRTLAVRIYCFLGLIKHAPIPVTNSGGERSQPVDVWLSPLTFGMTSFLYVCHALVQVTLLLFIGTILEARRAVLNAEDALSVLQLTSNAPEWRS